jgi:hypothetical protein
VLRTAKDTAGIRMHLTDVALILLVLIRTAIHKLTFSGVLTTVPSTVLKEIITFIFTHHIRTFK